MIALTIREIAAAIDAKIHGLGSEEVITESAIIDSRIAKPGTFFVALPGENLDGNNFAQAAIQSGSRFAITSREISAPCLVVTDTLQAIQALAKFVREKSTDCTFIGITGSQGKTTTKELLGHILSTSGETVIPQGSFNNEIGLPLTILSCTDATKYCVLEMGARHLGDIATLCSIAQPQVGAVLVVGQAHIGEVGSREVIAKAKGELVDSLLPGSIAVLGNYDEFTPRMGESRKDIRRIVFGEDSSCVIRAADIEVREGRAHFDLVTPAGRAAVSLRIPGLHQIANALAAAAIATSLNISLESIAAALSTADLLSKWRMELHEVNDVLVINDSYNANPESMKAALSTLSLFAQERGGSSWAFLGKMHELGESERGSHTEIGRLVDTMGIDHLVEVGTDLYGSGEHLSTSFHHCADLNEALGLALNIQPGDCLLFKASRAESLNLLADKVLTQISEYVERKTEPDQ